MTTPLEVNSPTLINTRKHYANFTIGLNEIIDELLITDVANPSQCDIPNTFTLGTCLTLIERAFALMTLNKALTYTPHQVYSIELTLEEWINGDEDVKEIHGYGTVKLNRYWTTDELSDIVQDLSSKLLSRIIKITPRTHLGPDVEVNFISPFFLLVRIPTKYMSPEVYDDDC